MKQLSLFLVLFLLFASLTAERFVARIENPSPADFTRFSMADYDICAYHPGLYLDLLLDNISYQTLKSEYTSLHITQTEAQLKQNLVSDSKDIPGYKDYSEMLAELLQLQAQHPNLLMMESIGDTWGSMYNAAGYSTYQNFDHQIWAIKLSDNVTANEDEPYFYFVGEHHAREPISMETVMGILNHLLDGYGTDPEITNIIDNSQIWFVPLLNPDGHKIVIDQTDVWWRKNLIDNNSNHSIDLGSSGYGTDGTDLNRNYGYKWGYISASGDPSSITYHGSEPFSEVETQAFKSLVESQNFLAGISYHTYGQYVLYPFGYMYDILSPDAAELQALANAMAASILGESGGNYTPMPSYSLYPVSGSLDDWAYGTKGTFAYTIEMAEEFIPAAADVPTIVQNNLTAAKLLLTRMNTKILKGHVTDAFTGLPLAAQVHVVGIDDNPLKTSVYVTDEAFGSFYRFLPLGIYQVKFMRWGYETIEMSVQIVDNAPTVYDVAMLPCEPVDLSISFVNSLGMPIIDAQLEFIDLENGVYTTDTDGQISISSFSPGAYRIRVQSPGYEVLERTLNVIGPNITIILGATTTVTEDFETDLSAWQTSGSWGRSSSVYNSGTFSLSDSPSGNYTSNTNSTCKLLQPINLQGVLNANLQFYAKYNISLDSDYCSLLYSTNGTQWRYLDHFVGVLDWQLHSYSLNHLLGNNVYLRFKMSSTGSGNADGIYIDDFKVFTSSNPVNGEDELLPLPTYNLARYPNPFSQSITFDVSASAKSTQPLRLAVYNLKGQLVKELIHGTFSPGNTAIKWDSRDKNGKTCASGIYFARLSQGDTTLKTIKAILIK